MCVFLNTHMSKTSIDGNALRACWCYIILAMSLQNSHIETDMHRYKIALFSTFNLFEGKSHKGKTAGSSVLITRLELEH